MACSLEPLGEGVPPARIELAHGLGRRADHASLRPLRFGRAELRFGGRLGRRAPAIAPHRLRVRSIAAAGVEPALTEWCSYPHRALLRGWVGKWPSGGRRASERGRLRPRSDLTSETSLIAAAVLASRGHLSLSLVIAVAVWIGCPCEIRSVGSPSTARDAHGDAYAVRVTSSLMAKSVTAPMTAPVTETSFPMIPF